MRTFAIAIAVLQVFLLGAPLFAQDDPGRRGDQDRERQLVIEKLRREEGDLQAKLDAMREKLGDGSVKVKEVRKQLEGVREEIRKNGGEVKKPERPRVKDAEKLRDRIGELERNLQEAKERGEGERADKIRRELDELRGNLGKLQGGEGERRGIGDEEVRQMKEKIMAVRREAEEAAKRGEKERAEKLFRDAKEIERNLEERRGGGDRRGIGDEEVRQMKEKIMAVRGEAEEAAKRGEKERAEKLFRDAKEIERNLQERRGGGDRGRPEDLVDKIAQLRKEAIGAKRDGDPRHAMELWGEANRMEADLARATGIGPEGEGAGMPRGGSPNAQPGGPGRRPMAEVQGEIDRLRQEVRELREILDRALSERPRREGDRREGDRPPRERERGDGDRRGGDRPRGDGPDADRLQNFF
jgi:hypothetical protein